MTRPTSHFGILPSATLAVWAVVFELILVMRKRSKNHFPLHVTSKTPYSFTNDLPQGLTTTSKAIRKRYWQTIKIKKRNIIQWNIQKDNNFYSRRHVLRVKCLWKSWVMNKTLQIKASSLSFNPPSMCLLLFKMNSRQEYIAESLLFTTNRINKLFFRTFSF